MDLRNRVPFFMNYCSGYMDTVSGVSPLSLPKAKANSLQYVKAFGGTEQRDIPDNYLQRQYIYMMDGSYLLTDIVPTYDCKIEMDFRTTSTISQAATYLSSSSAFGFAHISDKTFRVNAWGNTYDSTTPVANDTRYKFTYNNLVATLKTGDTTVFTNTFTDTGTTTTPLTINGYGSPVSQNVEGIYLYSFKAWNAQGELIANYVPAVQKGTVLVVGFYDTVSKTFKTATAGTFMAGAEAVPTPDTPMDIVCNNGVVKYGNTSKNLVSTASKYIKLGEYTDASGNIVSSAVNFQTVSFPCKPNTTYTASISSSVQMLRICTYDASGVFVQRFNTQVSDGVKVITFTTGANVSQFNIGAQISNNNVTQQMIDAITWQIEEGSAATDYEPYNLEIYTDGTVETINVHGKNLIPDVANSSSAIAFADCVPIKAGTYKLSAENNWADVYRIYITTRDANGNTFQSTVPPAAGTYYSSGRWQSAANLAVSSITRPNGITVTINEDCYLGIGYSNNTTGSLINWQLERGSTVTTYEPYYNGGTATAEMLLKVGTYQDVQSIIDGSVTRNVGIKVLDGTEDWTRGTAIYANIPDLDAYLGYKDCYCTHFLGVNNSQQGAGLANSNKICVGDVLSREQYRNSVYVYATTTDFPDIATWTNWLAQQYAAGTPVIIVYPLATPTTESVAGQTLQVQAGNNTLEITQASLNNLTLEAKYKRSK